MTNHPVPGLLRDPIKSYWFLLAWLCLPWMLSRDSLWIDEAQTAAYAALLTPSEVWHKIHADNSTGGLSEGLMPLSMFMAWGWAKILGTSEWALRLPNLIYLGIGIALLRRSPQSHSLPQLTLLVALHPFVWYYAGEARPYSLQIALGCASLKALLDLVDSDGCSKPAWLATLITGFMLCASSLLCIIPTGAVCTVISWMMISRKWKLTRFHLITTGLALPPFLTLGFFYLSALKSSSSDAKLWEFGLTNIAYSLYELLGFQGVGPNRGAIREAARSGTGVAKVFLPYLGWLATLSLAWLGVAVAAIRGRHSLFRSSARLVFMVILISLAGYVLLGIEMKFPFWGRHLAPLLAFASFLAASAIARTPSQPLKLGVTFLLFVLFTLSSLSIRFSPRFENDDYRSASRFALERLASDETLWWAADTAGARYYGLSPSPAESPKGPCISVRNNSVEQLKGLPAPQWVVLSKPDIYDNNGNIHGFLKEGGYRLDRSFTSFSVWTR